MSYKVGISATNRNFKVRMGDLTAEAYLASPSIVAASAAVGIIAPAFDFVTFSPEGHITESAKPPSSLHICEVIQFTQSDEWLDSLYDNYDKMNCHRNIVILPICWLRGIEKCHAWLW